MDWDDSRRSAAPKPGKASSTWKLHGGGCEVAASSSTSAHARTVLGRSWPASGERSRARGAPFWPSCALPPENRLHFARLRWQVQPGPIDDTFDGCAPDLDSTVLRCVPKQNLWQRGQIGRIITTRQRLKAILPPHRYAVEGPRLWLVEGAVQSEGVPMASRARAKIVARKIKKYHPWGRDI